MPSNLKKLVRARMAETGESYQTALRQVRARAPGPAEPEPERTGTPAVPVSLKGRCFAWQDDAPVLLRMPGSSHLYIACFQGEDQLAAFHIQARVGYTGVKWIVDGAEFLASLALEDVVVICDPWFTPEGRTRYHLVVPRPVETGA